MYLIVNLPYLQCPGNKCCETKKRSTNKIFFFLLLEQLAKVFKYLRLNTDLPSTLHTEEAGTQDIKSRIHNGKPGLSEDCLIISTVGFCLVVIFPSPQRDIWGHLNKLLPWAVWHFAALWEWWGKRQVGTMAAHLSTRPSLPACMGLLQTFAIAERHGGVVSVAPIADIEGCRAACPCEVEILHTNPQTALGLFSASCLRSVEQGLGSRPESLAKSLLLFHL